MIRLDLTMSNLMADERFQHLRPSSYYELVKICRHCFIALTKIENERRKWQVNFENGIKQNEVKEEDSYEEEEPHSLDLKVSSSNNHLT